MTVAPLLKISGLNVSYAAGGSALPIVRDVSLTVMPEQAVGLVGESGSGKSTLAAAILNLLGPGGRIVSGKIEFEGNDLQHMGGRERRKLLGDRIGTVFQDPFTSLNPSLRIGLQIAEPLIQHRRMSGKQAADRARELLAEVGIARTSDVARAYPHQLSGGMKQRALIAAAIACEPKLIVLDEPTTALDVTIEAQILDLLEELRQRRQVSMLFISHNLAVVRRLCSSVYVLYAGEVAEQGPTPALFRQPAHPYTKGLFASLPRMETGARAHRLTSVPGSLPSLANLPRGCVFRSRCPFAEERCKSESQVLKPGIGSRAVRCWKAGGLLGTGWPASTNRREAVIREEHEAILEVTALTKKFPLGGAWSSVRRRSKGEQGFPFALVKRSLTAVDGVSFKIYPGEIVGLVGESGSGKSTLGRCLLRLVEPTNGSIRFEGREIIGQSSSELQSFRRAAQIIFQNPDSSLNPRMTIGEIIARPLELFGIAAGNAARHRVSELLELVRLSPDYAYRYPHQLSGGEKQRVGIARALASEPRFLICDEAVSALDVSVQAAVLNLLTDLRDQLGIAMLFISHDLSVVAHLADRIAVMYGGTICEIGPTQEILKPPYHPYTQALLSAAPQLGFGEAAPKRIRLVGGPVDPVVAGPQCRFHARCQIKIGAICENSEPPALEVSGFHRISCQHKIDTLRQMQAILPEAPTSNRQTITMRQG